MNKRNTLQAIACAALACIGLSASAQTFPPKKTITMVVGFAAGGAADTAARIIAKKLGDNIGASVVIDNRGGAGGNIAHQFAANGPSDGSTLLFGSVGPLTIAPHMMKVPYDPVKDFAPVSQVVSADFVLLVNPQKVPSKNVKDFVAWSQQQPNGLFMATFGAGTPGHFGAFMFGDAVKLKPEAIHYKTTSDALGGLFSGDVAVFFHALDDVELARPCPLGVADGVVSRRCFGQARQHGGFRDGDFLERFAKVSFGG